MTLDEIVRDVTFWLDATPPATAPQRAQELLARYRSGGRSGGYVTPRDYARVATHEASHAAVARSVGLTITHARVNEDGSGEAGYTRDDAAIDRRMATVATDLSGIVGELFADAAGAGRRWTLANSYDIAQARVGIDAFRAAVPEWNLPTRTFVIASLLSVFANWPVIERIARVLRERREIGSQEIETLCAELQ